MNIQHEKKIKYELPRQLSTFFGIGILQYIIDVAMFIICFSFFGMPIIFNIASRATAAIVGYYLNGIITFQAGDTVASNRTKLRFIVVWLFMTMLSSFAIGGVRSISEDQVWPEVTIAYSKPIIEIMLFILSFTIQKLWVFGKIHAIK